MIAIRRVMNMDVVVVRPLSESIKHKIEQTSMSTIDISDKSTAN